MSMIKALEAAVQRATTAAWEATEMKIIQNQLPETFRNICDIFTALFLMGVSFEIDGATIEIIHDSGNRNSLLIVNTPEGLKVKR